MVATLKIIRKSISKIIKKLRIVCFYEINLHSSYNFLIQFFVNFEAKGRPIYKAKLELPLYAVSL